MRAVHETEQFRYAIIEKLNSPRCRKKGHWREQSRMSLLFGALVEWFELVGAVITLTFAEIKHERRQSARSLHELDQARESVLSESADVGAYSLFVADKCGALTYE